ncbi:MAG TPA: hypothetical protein VGN15_03340, partial [Ktedonobacteraceae bacterium]|nr:hypothetical protein [Ktedonobacteraceae bacterium]
MEMDTSADNEARIRADWEARSNQHSAAQAHSRSAAILPPPSALTATSGAGQVTLRWQPVSGAMGYFILRSESPDGPFARLDHGSGGDVLAVPGPLYADTTGIVDTPYWYAVASISDVNAPMGELSEPIAARPEAKNARPLTLRVQSATAAGQLNPVWHMLGSEHLSQFYYSAGPGGSNIGAEFEEALRLARSELGTTHIRAHAILDDEQDVYQEVAGVAHYDFTAIDRI